MQLNPNYAFAHDQFALALAFTGRLDESIAESRLAAELNPLSPQVLVDAAYFFPVMLEGWIDLDARKFEEAIPLLEKAKIMDAPPFVSAYLAYAFGAAGDPDRALAELDELERISPGGQVLPFNLALDADSQMLGWLGLDAMFDPLRSEPRFEALLKKLNFIE